MLHKLRRAIVRPGRDRLRGVVEVDEAFWGATEAGTVGRGTETKVLIVVHRDAIEIRMLKDAIRSHLVDSEESDSKGEPQIFPDSEPRITLTVPAKLMRSGGEMRLIVHSRAAKNDDRRTVPSLIKAVVRARDWVRLILAGECKDHKAIAAVSGLDVRYVRLILPCAFLAPEIVEAIVKGHQGVGITLAALVDDVPLSWADQHVKISTLS